MELLASLMLEMLNGDVAQNKLKPFTAIDVKKVVLPTGVVKKAPIRKRKTLKIVKPKVIKEVVKKYSLKSYETRIRALLEAHTGLSFKKRRMKEMTNPLTNKPLELDLYCEELKLGLEYQGIQHTKLVPYYHKRGMIDLDEQIERDKMKVELCSINKIALVLISYGEISEEMLDTDILALCIYKIDVAIKLRDN